MNLGNLRVIVIPDGNGWFAQGLEIDFGASGSTLVEATTNFSNEIDIQAKEHLKQFSNINRMLTPAPGETWYKMLFNDQERVRSFMKVKTVPLSKEFPFDNIDYLVPS